MSARLPLEYRPPSGDLPLARRLDGIDWEFSSFVPSASARRLQGLHWYPGQFPEPLVTALIETVGRRQGGRFLDPFCGSGTAPFEAWTHGYRAEGLDANTHAIRIARAKTTLALAGAPDHGEALVASYRAYRSRRIGRSGRRGKVIAGVHPEARRWFRPEVLDDIIEAKQWIGQDGGEWAEVLSVLLSAILRGVSELREVPHSFIADRSKPGPAATSAVSVAAALEHKIRWAMQRGMERRSDLAPGIGAPEYSVSSCDRLATQVRPGITLCVSSPPYYGSTDYVRSQYLSWLVDPWGTYEADIGVEVGERRNRWAPMRLRRYLDAMEEAISGLRRVMAVDGHLVLVMGQSQCSFVQRSDPLAAVASMLTAAGFEWVWRRQRQVRFRKINRTPAVGEWIWVLRR